jgi:hypothetical protein
MLSPGGDPRGVALRGRANSSFGLVDLEANRRSGGEDGPLTGRHQQGRDTLKL